jgi:hypothetical protein
MKRTVMRAAFFLFLAAGFARAQEQIDVSVGAAGMKSSSSSNPAPGYQPQTMGGGLYGAVDGDFLWRLKPGRLGVGLDVSWRASRNLYLGYQPYRPLYFDFNAVWTAPLNQRVSYKFLAGMGAQHIFFYGVPSCAHSSYCPYTLYYSDQHALGTFGGSFRLYFWQNAYLEPEVRALAVQNNYSDFSSTWGFRGTVSIGYTFR